MTTTEPDDSRIVAVELLDQRCRVLCTVVPVGCDIGLELQAPAALLEQCWFLRALDADGGIVETRTTELGEAMKVMRLGPRRRDI